MLNQVKLMSRYANKQFSINDLNTDPMTLTLKLYLDMVKMYYHTKNEVSLQKLAQTDTWTHTDTHTHTHTHYENIASTTYAGGIVTSVSIH